MTEEASEQGREVGEMSTRVAAWLAWSLCLLCVALAVAGLILALLNGLTLGEIFLAWSGPPVATLLTQIVSFSVVGALIASHRPENSIGWLFLAAALFYGIQISGEEYAVYALLTNPGSLPLGAELAWLTEWFWAPGFGIILVFLPLLFPDGHPPSRRWRGVGWLGGLSIGLICVLTSIVLWPERGPTLLQLGGYAGEVEAWRSAVSEWVLRLGGPMLLLAGLGAVISLVVRFRRARGDVRQQIKWFASAAALTVVWLIVFQQSTRGLPEAIVALSGLLVIASIPVATGIAILRYRLYDIDLIINRTLVYGSLSASCCFGLLRRRSDNPGDLPNPHQPAGATATGRRRLHTRHRCAVQPLKATHPVVHRPSLLQEEVRHKEDPGDFLGGPRDETDLQALRGDLIGVVRETMQPAHVSLWLRPETARKREHA